MPKVARNPAVDPALPKVPLTLDGQTYHLCFTFAALALAESKLRESGLVVNMLHSLDLAGMDATRLVPVLYAAILTHEPGITVEAVAKMVTLRNLPAIFEAIANAYSESIAEPAKDAKASPLAEQPVSI